MLKKPIIKNMLIIKKRNDRFNMDRLKKVGEYLAKKHSVKVYVEPNVYSKYSQHFHCFNEKMADKIDLCISIGGDGTLLYLNSLFQKIDSIPPVLAFSTGNLGFLINFHHKDIEKVIEKYLTAPKNFHISNRSTLTCTTMENGLEKNSYRVLNELTIERGEWLLPIPIEIYLNNKLLTETRADGIIVSTPTGSTAYSMSAGGSMVSPSVSAILLTPICPHTLSFRPLILPDETVLRLRIPKLEEMERTGTEKACLTYDGQVRKMFSDKEEVVIKISNSKFPLIKNEFGEHYWFRSLQEKLHWNKHK